jgi:hypothetical protein
MGNSLTVALGRVVLSEQWSIQNNGRIMGVLRQPALAASASSVAMCGRMVETRARPGYAIEAGGSAVVLVQRAQRDVSSTRLV